MSRFLLATVPVPGHVTPGLPLARALVQRGHEVCWYTGHRFRATVEATGAHFLPMSTPPDYDASDLDAAFPGRKGLTGLKGMKWDIKHMFIDAIPHQVADLRAILRLFPADAILADPGLMGAATLNELGGPPYAHYGISALTLSSRDTAPFGLALPPDASPLGRLRNHTLYMLFERVLFRDVTRHANGVRQGLGLPPLQRGVLDSFSPFLYLQGGTPAFEYPRSDLAPQVHFIGPLIAAPERDWTPPFWWEDVYTIKPVVHVTQGTVATDADDLLGPTLQALADEKLLVVATTGGQTGELERLGSVPANARVDRFLPHAHLLPHVDVMITNGGYGGVQTALAHGLPLIVAGATEEKPEVAARVAWSGAGINLKTKSPTPEQIRAAVRTVLANDHYRDNARRIADDYARYDAPRLAVMLLEQLAATGQPVLRGAAQAHHSAQPDEAELAANKHLSPL